MNNLEKAILYVVATPIGNLEDITYRAIKILTNVDVILAEDTRITGKLLTSLNIKNNQKLVSCHNFNEELRLQYIKDILNSNQNIALVTDAGTPLISDPGYKIVASLRKEKYKIVPIPGVSAIITALSAAGLPSDNFIFKGFLSSKKNKRQKQIYEFRKFKKTVILYESVHRINYLLEDLLDLLPDNNIVIAKELTKIFEKFISGSVKEVFEYFKSNKHIIKGEFVVIINCKNNNDYRTNNFEIDIDFLLKDLLYELPLNKVVKLLTKNTKVKKNQIYEKALKFKNMN